MKKNLVEIFFDQAATYPDHTAIVFKDERISYRALGEQVQSTAIHFSKKGIKQGTRVLVFVPMSIQLYQTVLALFSLGAVVVFVDEWADRKRLQKALQVVEVDAIIAPRKFILLAYLLMPFRSIPIKLSAPKRLSFQQFDYKRVAPNDTALITFTTGSTGLPKAANRTHQFLWEQFRILKDEIGAIPDDKCVSTLPIVLLSILGTGATGVIAEFNQKKQDALDTNGMLSFLKKEKVNLLIASPFFIEQLAKNSTIEIPNLRKIITGGAPVFPHTATIINNAFPNSEKIIAYGSTEAEPISTINMDDVSNKFSSMENGLAVGEIHPEIQLKIIKITDEAIELKNEDWHQWEVPTGEVGEIVVTGPHVLSAYHNSEEAFRMNKIKDGDTIWHRTGDSGRLMDGVLYLLGRSNSLIVEKGQVISPFIVEQQLGQIKGVNIGTMLLINEKKQLFVELENADESERIKNEINELALGHDEVFFIDRMPRDPRHFSKIEYKKLLSLE